MHELTQKQKRSVNIWLWCVIGMVITMIFVGGVTRLTESGLSMVNWRPLMGAIPPMNEQEWQEVFEQYQQYPQYQLVNMHMTLDEFKSIFFWEYLHRLLGRLVGVIFFFPFLYFVAAKRFSLQFALRIFVSFILGGLQGLLGWYMVKSGLSLRPDVSHFRLAAHLLLAFLIIGYTYWIYMQINYRQETAKALNKFGRYFGLCFLAVLVLQITYGAFVAGLDAGMGHNTFPLMNGRFFPRAFFFLDPAWINLFENNVAIQFIHRTLGWLLFILAHCQLFWWRNQNLSEQQRKIVVTLIVMVWVQFVLGVTTLIFAVPLVLASMHQLGAVALFMITLRYIFLFNPKSISLKG